MEDKSEIKGLEGVKKAILIAKVAGVPVTLGWEQATRLMDLHDQAVILLAQTMAVALDNLEYAPTKEKAHDDWNKIVQAQKFLTDNLYITPEMLERLK